MRLRATHKQESERQKKKKKEKGNDKDRERERSRDVQRETTRQGKGRKPSAVIRVHETNWPRGHPYFF